MESSSVPGMPDVPDASLTGCAAVYDITNGESFQRTTSWLDEINQHCPTGTVDLILLGNKADLASDRQVSMVQGTSLQCCVGLLTFASHTIGRNTKRLLWH
jgi:GTPase SAR1 family protein